jgi:hypothetical protein
MLLPSSLLPPSLPGFLPFTNFNGNLHVFVVVGSHCFSVWYYFELIDLNLFNVF